MSIKKPVNKIEKLIGELCPEGVEFRELGEVCEKTSNIKWQNNKSKQFQYIDLSSVDRNRNIITETQVITSETAPSRAQKIVRLGDVIFGTTRPTLKRFCVINHEYNEQICSTGFCVLRPKSETVLTNYIFHFISSSDFYSYTESNQKGASYPAISDNMVKKFKIPIPPLTIQKEIVKILDNFTQLEAELGAELEARKKQYEHYRDALLTFDDGVEFRELGECIEKNTGGGTPSKAVSKYWNGKIPWASVGDLSIDSIIVNSTRNFITEEGLRNSSSHLIPKGDVIVAVKISPGKMKIAGINITINQDLRGLSLKPFLNNRFLTYYFQTINIIGNGTIVKAITVSVLNRIKIPIPPLTEQKRIVAILDKFDALVNDITVGLPAEISARKKQYEYYRNELLTFKEKGEHIGSPLGSVQMNHRVNKNEI